MVVELPLYRLLSAPEQDFHVQGATTPLVITICGSMQFFSQMLLAAAELTAAGFVVLAPFCVVASADQTEDLKQRLDLLHLQKIDISSSVLVVTNARHYMGTSTIAEIAYAQAQGKVVMVREFEVD